MPPPQSRQGGGGTEVLLVSQCSAGSWEVKKKLSRAVRFLYPQQPRVQCWNNLRDHDTLLICPSESTESVSCVTGVIWPLLTGLDSVRQVEIRAFQLQWLIARKQNWKLCSASAAFSSFKGIAQLKRFSYPLSREKHLLEYWEVPADLCWACFQKLN